MATPRLRIEIGREEVIQTYGLTLEPDIRCDFRDPSGKRIQVGDLHDLHDESLVWPLSYREIQTLGIAFGEPRSVPTLVSAEAS